MLVTKRDGSQETIQVDKISARLRELCTTHKIKCAYSLVVTKVSTGLHDGITTSQIDELAAQEAASMTLYSSEYERLASVVTVSNLHKNTGGFVQTSMLLRGAHSTSEEYDRLVDKYGEELEKHIDYTRDYLNTYAAIQTALTVTLAKIENRVVERPQSNLMRVSLRLHGHRGMEDVLSSYEMLSLKMCVHGTPTHITAGLSDRLSSCYLSNIDLSKASKEGDDMQSFYTSVKEAALISNGGGGIGFSCSSIPATGSTKKRGGMHRGIMSALKVLDDVSEHSQNDTRKSAMATYLELWHEDIEIFIQSKLSHRKEELRAARLFPAMWISDLFMKRLLAKEEWSLFCPTRAPGLDTCHGEEFEAKYIQYEREGRATRKISPSVIWRLIIRTTIESGTPFILWKDLCNRFANLSHWGTIKSSNLCTEIIQYSSSEETAVCNLASIALPSCVVDAQFCHATLHKVACQLVKNLDSVIDFSIHPLESAIKSNDLHRTMGVGISGLADVFCMLRLPFACQEARTLNREIVETIYYSFLRTSCDIAKVRGVHTSYPGSKLSQGILNYMQFGVHPSGRWAFEEVTEDIKKYGVAHGLGVALMPTSNGSVMVGTNESFEPYSANIYTHRAAGGEIIMVNKHLEKELKALELWTPDVKNYIINNQGSIAGLEEIPQEIRDIYKTVWEVGMKDQFEMAEDRAPWIDQSQSFSIHYADMNEEKISNLLIKSWKCGRMKTGMYYCRGVASLKADILKCDFCSA